MRCRINLRLDSYLASKFLVLVFIAMIQVVLLFSIVRLWCGLPGTALWQWIALAAVAVAGTCLGMLISAFARTEEVAVALVPIAVMPQIILAGVIVPLTGLANLIAKAAITVHWVERALQALLADEDLALLRLDRADYAGQLCMALVHASVFVAATLWILRRRDRSKA